MKPVQGNSGSSQVCPSHPPSIHSTPNIDLAFLSEFTFIFHTHLFHLLLKVSIIVVRNHLCKSNLFRSSLKKSERERTHSQSGAFPNHPPKAILLPQVLWKLWKGISIAKSRHKQGSEKENSRESEMKKEKEEESGRKGYTVEWPHGTR